MPLSFWKRKATTPAKAEWQEVLSFHAACRHVAQQKYGTPLRAKSDRAAHPEVSGADWMAVNSFELMENIRGDAALDALDAAGRQMLLMIARAASDDGAAFEAALDFDRWGMADHLRAIRRDWQAAKSAPGATPRGSA